MNKLSRVAVVVFIFIELVLWVVVWSRPVAPFAFWDESYHLCASEKYLAGVMFMEPHPPLGKLLIAAGQWIMNENGSISREAFLVSNQINKIPAGYSLFGARLASTLLAALGAFIFFTIMLEISDSYWLAAVFSLFYICDNALIVHCRAAMLEGAQIFFILGAVLCFLRCLNSEGLLSVWRYVPMAVFAGLAIATKVNSAIVLVLFPILWLWETRNFLVSKGLPRQIFRLVKSFSLKAALTCIVIGIIIMAIFYVHFGLGSKIMGGNYYAASPAYRNVIKEGQTWSLRHFPVMLRDNIVYMKNYQLGVPALDLTKLGENGSHPLRWLIGGRTISYRWDKKGGDICHVYLVGNLVGWSSGLIGIGLGISLLIGCAVFGSPIRDQRLFFLVCVFTLMYVLYMVSVLRVSRVLYLYHYFIPLIFSWILSASIFKYLFNEDLERGDLKVHAGLVLLALQIVLVFHFFSPLTYHSPLNALEFRSRNWIQLWDLRDAP